MSEKFCSIHDKIKATGKWYVTNSERINKLVNTEDLSSASWDKAIFCAADYEIRAVRSGYSTAKVVIVLFDGKRFPDAGTLLIELKQLASIKPGEIALFMSMDYTISEAWEMATADLTESISIRQDTLLKLISYIEDVETSSPKEISSRIKRLGAFTRSHIVPLLGTEIEP